MLFPFQRTHGFSSGAQDEAFADAFEGSMGNIYDEKKNLDCFNPKSPLYFPLPSTCLPPSSPKSPGPLFDF
jgi:hypothetical protein